MHKVDLTPVVFHDVQQLLRCSSTVLYILFDWNILLLIYSS